MLVAALFVKFKTGNDPTVHPPRRFKQVRMPHKDHAGHADSEEATARPHCKKWSLFTGQNHSCP